MGKCATVGCQNTAVERVSYNYRGGERMSDDVCSECADGYSRRPVLHDFQRWPLVPNPVPADWPL